jgi:hypothetical protein
VAIKAWWALAHPVRSPTALAAVAVAITARVLARIIASHAVRRELGRPGAVLFGAM